MYIYIKTENKQKKIEKEQNKGWSFYILSCINK